MFEEVNHYLMAAAVISFVVCFVLRSYKNYKNWAPVSYCCTKPITKRGWAWLMTLSVFEALAISTTTTAICWIMSMLYLSI